MRKIEKTYAAKGTALHVERRVALLWKRFRQKKSEDTEACGILVATIDDDLSRIWLDHASPPSGEDSRKRFSFFMRGKDHQRFLDKKVKSSGGGAQLLGTWHTHPEEIPKPSQADIAGWHKVSKSNPEFRKFCFVIVGIKSTSVYLMTKGSLVQMKEVIPISLPPLI